MRILLDTHTLLLAAKGVLPKKVQSLLEDGSNDLYFSPVNLWEIELKKDRLNTDAQAMCQKLSLNGYIELPVTARHILALAQLPAIHHDPFDRALIAQAQSEQIYLLSPDEAVKRYSRSLEYIMGFKR